MTTRPNSDYYACRNRECDMKMIFKKFTKIVKRELKNGSIQISHHCPHCGGLLED